MTDGTTERHVAITGASGGIGRAVAVRYAAPHVVLHLAGRSAAALEQTAELCRRRSATVVTSVFDVRDDRSFANWIDEVTSRPGLEVLFFAAGVSSSVVAEGAKAQPETPWDLARELDVNAVSVILAANRAARQLAATDGAHVQIGLTASLAALTGLPSSPGYSASKAAVATFGQALRRLMKDTRVGVTVVLPGYVTSPMSARYQGAKPLEISAEAAAARIVQGLAENRARVVFPKLLAWGLWWLEVLPERWQNHFLQGFRFAVTPDAEAAAVKRAAAPQKEAAC